jgi:hypothetical protein
VRQWDVKISRAERWIVIVCDPERKLDIGGNNGFMMIDHGVSKQWNEIKQKSHHIMYLSRNLLRNNVK